MRVQSVVSGCVVSVVGLAELVHVGEGGGSGVREGGGGLTG